MNYLYYIYLVVILYVCVALKSGIKILSLSETITDIYLLCLDSYFHITYKEIISFRFLPFFQIL